METLDQKTIISSEGSKNSGMIPILIISSIILIGIGAGSYYIGVNQGRSSLQQLHQQDVQSPTPVIHQVIPTSSLNTSNITSNLGWKMMENQQVGITFQYPETTLPFSSAPHVPDNSYFGLDIFNSETKKDHALLTDADLNLEVIVYKPAKTSIESYLSAINATENTIVTNPFPGITGSYTKVKTITQGDMQTAIIYSEPVNQYSEYDAIIVSKGNNIATLRLMSGSDTKKETLLPLIESIANTFQFTDASSTRISSTPQENTLYLGMYNGTEALFLTNKNLQEYYENGESKTSPTIGELTDTSGKGYKPFEFSKLQNAKAIYTFLVQSYTQIDFLRPFLMNTTKNTLYISMYQSNGTITSAYDVIFQIDTDQKKITEILRNDVSNSKYEQKGSIILSELIDNKYIIANIGACSACDNFDPHGTSIINLSTKNEKYLGTIGNIHIDSQKNKVMYQKLVQMEEQCQPSPGCVNGKKTTYKPSGEIYTAELP